MLCCLGLLVFRLRFPCVWRPFSVGVACVVTGVTGFTYHGYFFLVQYVIGCARFYSHLAYASLMFCLCFAGVLPAFAWCLLLEITFAWLEPCNVLDACYLIVLESWWDSLGLTWDFLVWLSLDLLRPAG